MQKELIAHDLAVAYVINRHGAEITGEFSVGTWSDREVTGGGKVETKRLPGVDEERIVSVGTGERYFLGLLEKKQSQADGFAVDPVFVKMIDDYLRAYDRFLSLLERRRDVVEAG